MVSMSCEGKSEWKIEEKIFFFVELTNIVNYCQHKIEQHPSALEPSGSNTFFAPTTEEDLTA